MVKRITAEAPRRGGSRGEELGWTTNAHEWSRKNWVTKIGVNDPTKDSDGRVGRGWVAAGLPWRGIPELRHLSRAEAQAIHFRAWRAAWRRPAMWGVMLGCAMAGMILSGLVTTAT